MSRSGKKGLIDITIFENQGIYPGIERDTIISAIDSSQGQIRDGDYQKRFNIGLNLIFGEGYQDSVKAANIIYGMIMHNTSKISVNPSGLVDITDTIASMAINDMRNGSQEGIIKSIEGIHPCYAAIAMNIINGDYETAEDMFNQLFVTSTYIGRTERRLGVSIGIPRAYEGQEIFFGRSKGYVTFHANQPTEKSDMRRIPDDINSIKYKTKSGQISFSGQEGIEMTQPNKNCLNVDLYKVG